LRDVAEIVGEPPRDACLGAHHPENSEQIESDPSPIGRSGRGDIRALAQSVTSLCASDPPCRGDRAFVAFSPRAGALAAARAAPPLRSTALRLTPLRCGSDMQNLFQKLGARHHSGRGAFEPHHSTKKMDYMIAEIQSA
jgi:hypothetical protein